MPRRHSYIDYTVVFLLALLFLLAGLAVLPYPGIQNDEALFAAAIYAPETTGHTVKIFQRPVALMLMSYLGTLKAWIYAPIFALWTPSAWSLRVPVLLFGSITIFFLFNILNRWPGRTAALAAAALLATDATYLFTTCFDWGPVALQHLLTVAGVLALVLYSQTGRRRWLALGFFLFGLAAWDKALFGWTAFGLAFATLILFPRHLLIHLKWKNLVIAAVCFSAGAFPLLRYNVRSHGETLRASQGWSADRAMILGKAVIFQRSLDGSGLIGYLTFDDPAPAARAPQTRLERLAVALDFRTGRQRASLMFYAFLGAFLALPWVWGTRSRSLLCFALIVTAVAWSLMLFGVGVGASVHHVALLWPWPQVAVAAAVAGLAERMKRWGPVFAVVLLVLLCQRNLLCSNYQFSQLIRNGSPYSWSDAIYQLSRDLPTWQARQIVLLDWGMTENLRLLHRGRLPLVWGADPIFADPLDERKQNDFKALLDQPSAVFVSHTDAFQVFDGINRRRDTALQTLGYRRETLALIPDRHGRAVFEVFRVAPAAGP